MTRFVRLFSPDPVKDPTARLRLECDTGWGNAVLSDENVHPEERDNPDARHVDALATTELTTAGMRWLATVTAELAALMERQDADDQAEIDGVDQSDPGPASGVVLAEQIDLHEETTDPIDTDSRFDHGDSK